MAILTVSNLTKSFGSFEAVKDVSFALNKNRCVALIGPNGAGKTTILNMITGLLHTTKGHILFDGKGAIDYRSHIGFLPQQPVFPSWMTGEEFLIFSGRLVHLSKKVAKERSKELLQQFNLYEAKDQRISTFSGGMKQRLGIAQAIIHQPKLLVLDEPVSALDPLGRRDVLTLLKTLKQTMTVLFSTHILSDAEAVSDDVLLLKDGKLIEGDTIENLRKKYHMNVIYIQVARDVEETITLLSNVSDIANITLKEDTIQLTVTDVEQARKEIINMINRQRIPLTSFHIGSTSLEQMFMEAIKK